MTLEEIFIKFILPHWASGLSNVTALVALLYLRRVQIELVRRSKWEAEFGKRLSYLVKIHCSKYPDHAMSLLGEGNGESLREAMLEMRKLRGEVD